MSVGMSAVMTEGGHTTALHLEGVARDTKVPFSPPASWCLPPGAVVTRLYVTKAPAPPGALAPATLVAEYEVNPDIKYDADFRHAPGEPPQPEYVPQQAAPPRATPPPTYQPRQRSAPAHAAGNGRKVIRIGCSGKRWFAFDKVDTDGNVTEEGTPFEVDVIEAQNGWGRLYRSFLDESGKIPEDRRDEYDAAQQQFFSALAGQDLELAHVYALTARVAEEAEKLQSFFEVRKASAEPPSSPEGTKLTFSD